MTDPHQENPPSESTVDPASSDDVEAFREAFRRHAAGVAIVTTRTPDGAPVGFTATSLASLAAAPPLATFNMARTASSWPAVEAGGAVNIHLLGSRNRDVARRMAGPAESRFAGEHWTDGPDGLPLLHDVTAWMTGRIVERIPVADNAIVVVRITGGGVGAADDALLYHDRRYVRPGHLDD